MIMAHQYDPEVSRGARNKLGAVLVAVVVVMLVVMVIIRIMAALTATMSQP